MKKGPVTFGDNFGAQLRLFKFGHEQFEHSVEVRRWSEKLWKAHPWARSLLRSAKSIEQARDLLFDGIIERERAIRSRKLSVHPMEWSIIRDSCRVMRNILSKRCEKMAGFSSLEFLWKIANRKWNELPGDLKPGFFEEFHHLLLGVRGKSGIYEDAESPKFTKHTGRRAAQIRSNELDGLSEYAESRIDSFSSGLDEEVVARRKKNRQRLKRIFKDDSKKWRDWRWQLAHVIRDDEMLGRLIDLTHEEREAIRLAKKNRIPFGVTPYYCSLMDPETHRDDDHAIRAQVIPTRYFVQRMAEHRRSGKHSADFMLERDTSPIDLVVRRYPRVAIFKPYDTCAQICVYCQRNWEIQDVLCPKAMAPKRKIDEAIDWFEGETMLKEVLITGGDPLIMNDRMLEHVLKRFARMRHIERIRIGSRTPVVLPYRITDNLVRILEKYHDPPLRELRIVTTLSPPSRSRPRPRIAFHA